MKRGFFKILMPVGLCLSAAPAWAEDPYYFHKAGVSREQYMADVNLCAALSTPVRVARNQPYQPYMAPNNLSAANNAIAAGISSFFVSLMEGRERRRTVSRIERTCMADKGYTRRSLDKPAFQEIRNLRDDARIDRMFALVSAAQPLGKVLVE